MMRHIPRTLGLSATKAASIYLVFGIVWIGGTDWLAVRIAANEAQLVWLQSIKGWVFVGMSTVLIFGLVWFRERQIERVTDQLKVSVEQLQVIHRVFRHNLRNELTKFRGYLELVEPAIHEPEPREYLSLADRAAERIERLNEHLRIVESAGDPTTGVVDLVGAIEDECNHLMEDHPHIEIDMDLPADGRIHSDDSVELLIREMIEYLTDIGDGAVEVQLTREDPNQLVLHIEAPGVRIPDTERTPVEQGEETALAHANGVRLWVIKWLANYYSGEFALEITDQGTTFRVQFTEVSAIDRVKVVAQDQVGEAIDASRDRVIGLPQTN